MACCNERRLRAVAEAGVLNGLEYVEVRDRDEPDPALRQRTLYVRLLLPVPGGFTRDNVTIDGGERIPSISVTWAASATALPPELTAAEQADLLAGLADPDRVLVVRTDDRGDFSRYTLRLVAGADTLAPPVGFDPQLVEVDLSFKVECPSEFDCTLHDVCPPPVRDAPVIDYLAKDYEGFRRQMLERVSLLSPGWTTRNPADVGVTIVELLASVADELSYQQDAIATEAYLGTARSRVSLRRHARLVDHHVHEGCNARVWVRVSVDSPTVVLPAGTTLLTHVPGVDTVVEPDSADHARALAAGPETFETVETAVLHADLDELRFWTWGEEHCCLPRGSTSATLHGLHEQLRPGDVLVLAETLSPTTLPEALADPALTEDQARGRAAADADPARRWAVRLVDVRTSEDPAGGLFDDTVADGDPVPVTEVAWDDRDALPFPLCLDAGGRDLETAHAWGNVVLADHGARVTLEDLGTVPAPNPALTRVPTPSSAHCAGRGGVPVPPRFRPTLAHAPLTHTVVTPPTVAFEERTTPALDAELAARSFGPALQALLGGHGIHLGTSTSSVRGDAPRWSVGDRRTAVRIDVEAGRLTAVLTLPHASGATVPAPRDASPAIALASGEGGTDPATWVDRWLARGDLLASAGGDRAFCVEAEHDGTVHLRFGDDEYGRRPDSGTGFVATYRVGNGVAGNVGAGAVRHVVTTVGGIEAIDNPLAAGGGVQPETAAEVRRDAPQAFTVQERTVTEADHVEKTELATGVQRAAATMRWTGSWHTAFVTVDRTGGTPMDDAFADGLRDHLERYRMARYDLEIDGPRFVPLELGLFVCVEDDHLRSHVRRAVRDVLGTRTLPDGTHGLFHPDRLTFGQPVSLSSVYARVQGVPGVASVDVTAFHRQREPQNSGLASGVLEMGRLEIARLDDDPNFPERGVVHLELGGGQ